MGFLLACLFVTLTHFLFDVTYPVQHFFFFGGWGGVMQSTNLQKLMNFVQYILHFKPAF